MEKRSVIYSIAGSRDCHYCYDGECHNNNIFLDNDDTIKCEESVHSFPEKCPLPVIYKS